MPPCETSWLDKLQNAANSHRFCARLEKAGATKSRLSRFSPFPDHLAPKEWDPKDLIRFWLGHADETVTDGYSKLREDVEYRKEVAEEVGFGFAISAENPVVVPNVPSFGVTVAQENAA